MSPCQFGAHQQTRVHRMSPCQFGAHQQTLWGTRLALGSKKHSQGCGPKQHGWERVEHHRYQESLMHLFYLGALNVLAQFSHLEDSRLVHLWGLTADWSTLGRIVWVDILGHSAQWFINQEVVKEET
jgi:hypothetical protein